MDGYQKNLREIVFTREKVAYAEKVTEEYLTQLNMEVGREDLDFIREQATLQFSSFLLSHMNAHQVIRVQTERPSFLDWLLRRKPVFNIEVKCMEVLKNPPRLLPEGQSTFIFKITEINPEEDERNNS